MAIFWRIEGKAEEGKQQQQQQQKMQKMVSSFPHGADTSLRISSWKHRPEDRTIPRPPCCSYPRSHLCYCNRGPTANTVSYFHQQSPPLGPHKISLLLQLCNVYANSRYSVCLPCKEWHESHWRLAFDAPRRVAAPRKSCAREADRQKGKLSVNATP